MQRYPALGDDIRSRPARRRHNQVENHVRNLSGPVRGPPSRDTALIHTTGTFQPFTRLACMTSKQTKESISTPPPSPRDEHKLRAGGVRQASSSPII